jgi:hypothetical protein
MTSRYVAFIVRLRFDDPGTASEQGVHGSLQQVGSEQIQYFDSFAKALALLREAALPPASDIDLADEQARQGD